MFVRLGWWSLMILRRAGCCRESCGREKRSFCLLWTHMRRPVRLVLRGGRRRFGWIGAVAAMVSVVPLRTKCRGSSPFDFAQGQNDNLRFIFSNSKLKLLLI